METNFLVYIISHITITGYKTKTATALHAFKIRHKLSVVSGLNNACPYPEPALTHLSKYTFCLMVIQIQHNSFQFTNISGKLSACANSGYQALSFPTHREPGYEASVHLSRERW